MQSWQVHTISQLGRVTGNYTRHTDYSDVDVYMCRFTPEEKAKRHPCAYMPFGNGPRNCIGMRFALLEVKMALIEIFSKFKIVLAPETKVSIL